MHRTVIRVLTLVLLTGGSMSAGHLQAQEKEGWLTTFTDTTDGALDLSRFLVEHNGFVPVLMVITEPALGGFGLALALCFW